jgi:hypothetical protein
VREGGRSDVRHRRVRRDGTSNGLVCEVDNLLDEDEMLTGLARPGPGKGTLMGHDVNGCVGVQFSDGVVLSSLIMKIQPASGMCGHSCIILMSDGCATAWLEDRVPASIRRGIEALRV